MFLSINPILIIFVSVISELLIFSLDLVKTRVVVMSVEMRKTFIGAILVGLIEKTQDIKVMKAITKVSTKIYFYTYKVF